MSNDCQLEENKASCNCPETNCERRGACCQCVAYHRKSKDLPYCLKKFR